MKHVARTTALSVALFLAAMALAAWPPPVGADELPGAVAATDQELSAMRGGFVTNEGLLVSFGIERAIYVNGILSTASSFTVSRVDGTNGLKYSASMPVGANTVKVLQIGPAGSNVFSPGKIAGAMLPGGFTVIQNALNNQVVKNITTINASVTNMNLFRDMNLTSSIRQQMIHAIR